MSQGVAKHIRDGIASASRELERLKREMARLHKEAERVREEIREREFDLRIAETRIHDYRQLLEKLPREEITRDAESDMIPGSAAYKSLEALRAAGKPLNVSAILKLAGVEATAQNKRNYRSAMSLYARQGKVFTKPGRGLFGLAEWGTPTREGSAAGQERGSLPEDDDKPLPPGPTPLLNEP